MPTNNTHGQLATHAAPNGSAATSPSRGFTVAGIVMGLFPLTVAALAAGCLTALLWAPSLATALALLFVLYGLPLIAYRLHARVVTIKVGAQHMVGRGYCPWYGAHQLQLVYIAFPALETLLRLVPGLFSLWLRAWGSRIGRNVYWTPHLEVLDRGLLDVGDGVIFGHRVGLSSHIIRPTRDNLLLYVKRVRIGDHAFVGAGSYLGPGCVIEAGALVAAGSHVYPRQRVAA